MKVLMSDLKTYSANTMLESKYINMNQIYDFLPTWTYTSITVKGLLKKPSSFKIRSARLIQMAKGQLFRNPW